MATIFLRPIQQHLLPLKLQFSALKHEDKRVPSGCIDRNFVPDQKCSKSVAVVAVAGEFRQSHGCPGSVFTTANIRGGCISWVHRGKATACRQRTRVAGTLSDGDGPARPGGRRAGRKPKTVLPDDLGMGKKIQEEVPSGAEQGMSARKTRGARVGEAEGPSAPRGKKGLERKAGRGEEKSGEKGLLTNSESVPGQWGEGGGTGQGYLSAEQGKGLLVKAQGAEEEKEESIVFGEWGEEGKFGWPPLIVCMGEALNEFVPLVRVNMDQDRQDDAEVINTWKAVQWSPPEFARTPGGPSSNVAIALGRMDARVGFLGRLGDDATGRQLADAMWQNGVMVDGITFDPDHRTGHAKIHLEAHPGGKLEANCQVASADMALEDKDVDQELLEEARILHVTTMSLLTEPSRATVIANVRRAKARGTRIFLDVNLPLYLWSSQEKALNILRPVWVLADVVKLSCAEFEFLANEAYFERKRMGAQQYAAKSEQQARGLGNPFHYDMREVLPMLPPSVELLLVTNGTWSVHYYAPKFNGFVVGTEDVLVSAYHCDRTGSGDVMTAAFLRKLSICPEILHNEDRLRRAVRFAISAGIMSQWIPGAVKSFPTENAVQNMAEQVYTVGSVQM